MRSRSAAASSAPYLSVARVGTWFRVIEGVWIAGDDERSQRAGYVRRRTASECWAAGRAGGVSVIDRQTNPRRDGYVTTS
jgi:hypothetical protein